MNELIRKLAKKSGFSLDSNGIYTAKLEHLPITENIEKFAELIVKETMQVVANQLPSNVYLDVADAVIKHFESK
jgi:hypothetical protein